MNTTAKALVVALAASTSVAALALGFSGPAAQPAPEIVKLERVVIVGKRMQATVEVARLPQVVITGSRAAQTEVQLAAARLAKAI